MQKAKASKALAAAINSFVYMAKVMFEIAIQNQKNIILAGFYLNCNCCLKRGKQRVTTSTCNCALEMHMQVCSGYMHMHWAT